MDKEINKIHIFYDRNIYLDRKMKDSIYLNNAVVISASDSDGISGLIEMIYDIFPEFMFIAKIKDFSQNLEDYRKNFKLDNIMINEYNDTHFITKTFSEMILRDVNRKVCKNLCINWGHYTGGAFMLGFDKPDSYLIDIFLKKVQFSDENTSIDYLCQNLTDFCFIQQEADNGVCIVTPLQNFQLLQNSINQYLYKTFYVN